MSSCSVSTLHDVIPWIRGGGMIGVPNELAASATGKGSAHVPLRAAGRACVPSCRPRGGLEQPELAAISRLTRSHTHTRAILCVPVRGASQYVGAPHHTPGSCPSEDVHLRRCLIRAVRCSGKRHKLRVRHSDIVTLHPRWLPRIGMSTVSVAFNAPPRRARGLEPVPRSLHTGGTVRVTRDNGHPLPR